MKNYLFILIFMFFWTALCVGQSVGINSDGSVPDRSAMLDVKHSNKGFLLPRVVLRGTNDVITITHPASSLLVYNTATTFGNSAVSPGFYYWDGKVWIRMSTSSDNIKKVVPSQIKTFSSVSSSVSLYNGGAENFVTKWTGDTTLGNSIIYDNGINIGIGTILDAGYKLDVNGTTRLQDTITFSKEPAASSSAYDILTRNTVTGVVEKISTTTFAPDTGSTNYIQNQTSQQASSNFNISGTGIVPALYGSTLASGNLTFSSTTHVDKGKLLFGNSAYDEATNRLGIGTTVDAGFKMDVNGTTRIQDTLTLSKEPAISTSAYDILTRNTVTGVVEKISTTTFAPDTGSTKYIQNQTTQQASSNFNISGTGILPVLYGSTLASGNLTFSSTNHVDKGKLLFGTSAYDEKTNSLGIGTITPIHQLDIFGSIGIPNTLDSSSGILYKGNVPFIHNFGATASEFGNTFIGVYAGNLTMSTQNVDSIFASNNTIVGFKSLSSNTTGYRNVALGTFNLTNNTTGYYNTALGNSALRANISGHHNTSIGGDALFSNRTGVQNIAVGVDALQRNISGNENVAVGNNALVFGTTGNSNVAVGFNAAFKSTTGHYNTTMGSNALFNNITSEFNVALGAAALYSTLLGGNTGVGADAGRSIADGNNNSFFGYLSGNNILQKTDATNSTGIGYQAYTTKSNQVVIGNSSVTETLLNGNVGIGSVNPTSKLYVADNTGATLSLTSNGLNGSSISPLYLTLDFLGYQNSNKARIRASEEASNTSGSTLSFLINNGNGASNLIERMTILKDGNVGISNVLPSEKLDVTGNIRFSGALMPNNTAGTLGQVLQSNGAGVVPTWVTPAATGITSVAGTTNQVIASMETGSVTLSLPQNIHSGATPTFAGLGLSSDLNQSVSLNGNITHFIRNNNAGALSTARTLWNASGNSWSAGMGSSANNSNAFSIREDALGVNTERFKIAIGGAITATSSITASSFIKSGGTSSQFLKADGSSDATAYLTSTTGVSSITGTSNQVVASASAGAVTLSLPQSIAATSSPTFNGLTLLPTTSSSTGVIFKGTDRFLHNFALAGTSGYNTFLGALAGNFTMTGSTGTQGSNNTGIGVGALNANTTGSQNTALGMSSMFFNTSGSQNTALGYYSLLYNTTGVANVANGIQAGFNNRSGSNNVALGNNALYNNTGGANNIALGSTSLYDLNITTATGNNTVIGFNTGRGIITGINNTIIGANVTGLSSALSNNIILADGAGNQRITVNSTGNVRVVTTPTTSTVNFDIITRNASTGVLEKVPSNTYLTSSTGVTSITGTPNQIIASSSTGAVTLNLPQNIATTSSPTFGGLSVSGLINGSISGNAATVTTNANLTGDVTSIGNLSTLATVNSNIGTFNNVTVNSKGLITAASNASYLTGNQTITFSPTGDVTGSTSGTTSLAPILTIDANKVTLSKLQQIATGSLLGRSTAATGNVEVISIGAGLNLSGGVLSNAGPSGTVTSFSFANGNGFTGSVANAGTTPSLSLVLQNATTSQSGQLSNTDWNTFNNKQPLLNGTGFIKASGTTITYDNSTYLTSTTGAGLYQPLENQRLSTLNNVQFGNIAGSIATFTGSVTGITESLSDNSTKLASTAFVKGQSYLTSSALATDPAVVHTGGTETITGAKTFTNIATFGSGVSLLRRAIVNAPTTLLATDFLIAYTTLTATRAVTLPSAASVAGQHFVIKDESGSAVSFAVTIVGTVDGAVNPVAVNTAYGKYRIYSNGVAWFTE